jgi:hypothetical protein
MDIGGMVTENDYRKAVTSLYLTSIETTQSMIAPQIIAVKATYLGILITLLFLILRLVI